MKFSARRHTAIALLLFCSLLVFLKLGAAEIDIQTESPTALRIIGVLQGANDWGDIGAESTYKRLDVQPPLTAWMGAFFLKTFGINSFFALRLYPALCACGVLVLLHLLARRIVSWEMSLVAPALLAGTGIWNDFARQITPEVPLVFFVLLALFCVLKARDAEGMSNVLQWSALFGVAFGAALLTKLTISLLPLIFLIPFPRFWSERKGINAYLWAGAVFGMGIALPWYVHEATLHGTAFFKEIIMPSVFVPAAYTPQTLGIFYYINLLLLANPIVIFAFAYRVLVTLKMTNTKSRHPYLEYNLLLWSGMGLILFSVALVKFPQYGVYLIVPAILLSVRGLEELTTHFANHRLMWSMLALLIAITAWAFIPPVRDSFYAVFTGENFTALPAIIFTFAFAALLTVGWFLPSSTVLNISMRVFFWMNFVLPALLIGNVFLENSYSYLQQSRQPNPRTELQSLLKTTF
jgi:4-amino-4-deoxy-L-arabinose transferase-like glycosyltransferase